MRTNPSAQIPGCLTRPGAVVPLLAAFVLTVMALSTQPVAAQNVAPAAAPVAAAVTAAPAAPAAVPDSNYLIQANDLVEVLIFQEDDMTRRLRVAKDGSINLPLIGSVTAGRRTADDLAATIRRQLADGYLANPQVSVTVLAYAKRRFTILGQVNRPGAYDIPDNAAISLVQAVGMAGGYTRLAAPKKVLVKRTVNGQETVQRLDVERMARDERAAAFEVLSGDTITVPESFF